eukprot:6481763-Amphidinium_carterae.1
MELVVDTWMLLAEACSADCEVSTYFKEKARESRKQTLRHLLASRSISTLKLRATSLKPFVLRLQKTHKRMQVQTPTEEEVYSHLCAGRVTDFGIRIAWVPDQSMEAIG